eukprot:7521014-Pyramimonas_sp.AAC.1
MPKYLVNDLVHIITCISAQPPVYYCNMLQFLGDFCGRAAETEERRLGSARSKSFSSWLKKALRGKS